MDENIKQKVASVVDILKGETYQNANLILQYAKQQIENTLILQ